MSGIPTAAHSHFSAMISKISRIAVVWIVLGVIAALALRHEISEIEEGQISLARERAFSVFKLIETTRLWNSQHGSVYVPVTEKTPSNPYVHLPNRDVTTSTGQKLTMVTPAHMTNEIAELLAGDSGVSIHLTSLKPIRPENRPDEWERIALESFEKGVTERLELISGPPPIYRYIAPLRVKQACIKCHEEQGFKTGQTRGGLSISISAAKGMALDQAHTNLMTFKHIAAWIALSTIITLLMVRQRRFISQLERQTVEQQETIAKRTAELKKLNYQLQIDRQRYKEYAEMSSDWIWEQGADLRFTTLRGKRGSYDSKVIDPEEVIGKTLEETGAQTRTSDILAGWQDTIMQRMAFRDFECFLTDSKGRTRWYRLSGQPMFDENMNFSGYHGTGQDITDSRRSQEILDRISLATASTSGEAFYIALSENLAKLFGAHCVYLATLNDARDTLSTRAIWTDGRALQNFDFHVHGTPCAKVISQCTTVADQDVRAHFAGSPIFRTIDAQTYLGTPITDQKGNVIGTLAVINASYQLRSQEQMLLKIFSARAALEIERQATMSELHRAAEKLKLAGTVIQRTQEGVVITNAQAIIQEVNPAFCEITGYPIDELRGRNPSILKSGRQDKTFYQSMWKTILEEGQWHGEIWNRRKDGSLLPQMVNISSLTNEKGEITHYVGVFTDISLIKEQQRKLEDMAFFDRLTGLPNRALLADRMELAIADAERHQRQLAIAFLDLDGFKAVNDQLGHDTGDLLLIQAAHRLRDCMRASDTVARLGGDEFVLIIRDLDDTLELERSLDRILRQIRAPYYLGDNTCNGISGSLGVAIYPTHGSDADALLRASDSAMYEAKQSGRNCFRFFRSN